MCATTKIKNTSRKLVVVGVYLKPNLKANLRIETMACIKDAVSKSKEEMNDPYIVIIGDFNMFRIAEAIADFPDIIAHPTPPTRGRVVLDIIASNLDVDGTVFEVRGPLVTEDGSPSDHSIVHAVSNFSNSDRFTKTTTYSRKRTPRTDALMSDWIKGYDWTHLYECVTADDKASYFTDTIQQKMDELYPLKSRVMKSTDAPWITPCIKARIRARQRVYAKEERSNNWKSHKKETAGLVKKAKKYFYNKYVKLAKETNNPHLYYRAVGRLKNREALAPFSPADLFPGETHAAAAEKSADFFTRITENFSPLTENDCPRAVNYDPNFSVTEDDVMKRLKACKKPRGLLHGDLWPD